MSRWTAFVVLGVASTAAAEEPSPIEPVDLATEEPSRIEQAQDTEEQPSRLREVQLTAEKPAWIQHTVEGEYNAELSGFTDGTSTAAAATIGGDLRYRLGLINKSEKSSYDIETGAGFTVGRMQGTLATTQLATRAHLHVGPAMVTEGDDHANIAWLPFTFELDHSGALGALPRLSARPDANRGVFDQGQVSLATRMVRIEVSGTAPESDPTPGEPYSSAIDMLTLFGDVEATVQDGARLEAGLGGAMMSVSTRYTHGHRIDMLAPEFRATKLPDDTTASISTLWLVKAELSNPATGSTYTIGWGVAVGNPYAELATPTEENPNPDLNVGGLGFWLDRSWGGIGFQALREPYITMAGEAALDDRGWVQAWVPGRYNLSARGYVARTLRASEGVWRSDWSAGLELGASRKVKGINVDLTLEAGRTHYAALDGERPEIGFAARSQLSLRRSGRRSWSR